MAKTFTSSIATPNTGDVLTALVLDAAITTLNSHTVPPLMRARRAAAQAIGANSLIAINWDTADIATTDSGMWSPTSNKVTIQTAGVYLVTATLNFLAGSGSGPYGMSIYVNPTYSGTGDTATITAGTRITGTLANLSSATTQTVLSCTTLYSFAANDTVGVTGFQNSSASVNIAAVNEQNTLSLVFVGRTS